MWRGRIIQTLTGTARYASINAHKGGVLSGDARDLVSGMEQSRRDDLQVGPLNADLKSVKWRETWPGGGSHAYILPEGTATLVWPASQESGGLAVLGRLLVSEPRKRSIGRSEKSRHLYNLEHLRILELSFLSEPLPSGPGVQETFPIDQLCGDPR